MLLVYSTLINKTSFSWIYCECGFPNFDSTLFCTQSINSSNPFSVLSELSSQVDFETNDTTFPKTSTPIKTTGTDWKSTTFKNRKHGLRAMIINCDGMKSEKKKKKKKKNQADFRAAVDQHSPDVILGCESKLDSTLATYELFPSNYSVCRKDRSKIGGGVFIATKDFLITAEEPDFDVNGEIAWRNIQFCNSKPLLLASYYRSPSNKGPQSLDSLVSSNEKNFSKNGRKHPNLVIGGDFNVPDIDWNN